MGNCDYRIIEGCKVYSYSVECPVHAASPCRKSGAPLRKENRRKKLMLSILLVLLAPFAVIWDALHAAVSFVARRILGRAGKRGMAVGMLGTASCLLLLSAVLLTVL